MVGTLAYPAGTTLRTGTYSFEGTAFVYHDSLDIDITVVQFVTLVLVL